jgi:hypothetical protein
MSRERTLRTGLSTIEGRAWSGRAPVAAVELSTDGGSTWQPAELGPPELGPWAWRHWAAAWEATSPGRHVLCCRASDEAGNEQSTEAAWNLGGYANNEVQRVVVNVTS